MKFDRQLRTATETSWMVVSYGGKTIPRWNFRAGPHAWNKLPPPLRRVHSPDTFKRQLKTFLYNHAFNLHC